MGMAEQRAMSDLRRDQPVPLYYQIEVAIRRAIEQGQFGGGRLPTEEELAERYGVSRMTVRAALRRLEEDGLIERHRARGTFVRPEAAAKIVRHPNYLFGFEEDLRRQGAAPDVEVLASELIEPPTSVANSLGLAPGQHAHRLRRRGRVNGEPLWLESRYHPAELIALLPEHDLTSASITSLLGKTAGIRIGSVQLRVEAAAANPRQARYLGVRTGHPLLVSRYAYYATDGRCVEVLHAAFRADRYCFTFFLRASDTQAPLWADSGPHHQPSWPQLTPNHSLDAVGTKPTHEETAR